MSGLDEVTAFLRARYDEAEAIALGVEDHSEPWPGQWEADGNRAVRTYNGHVLAYAPHGELKPGFAAYVAANDPAHRLADIKLKRAILAEHATETSRQQRRALAEDIADGKPLWWYEDEYGCVICGWFDGEAGGCATVRQLGTEFDGHPAYRSEWTP